MSLLLLLNDLSLYLFPFPTDPDMPNIFGMYFMVPDTDFEQQTPANNDIDDLTIRENEPNEIRRIVCLSNLSMMMSV